jgi:hypothetical protein
LPGAELAVRHDEIAEALKVNRPSAVWQRLHDDAGLQASLPSFRRYALAMLPDAYARRPRITVRRDDRHVGLTLSGVARPSSHAQAVGTPGERSHALRDLAPLTGS